MIKDTNIFLLFIIVFLGVGVMSSAIYYVISFQNIKGELLDTKDLLDKTNQSLEEKKAELERIEFIRQRGDQILNEFKELRDKHSSLTILFNNLEIEKKDLKNQVSYLNSDNKRLSDENQKQKKDINRLKIDVADLKAKIASGQCP